MPNVRVYNETDNRIYTVTMDIFTSVLDKVHGLSSDGANGAVDFYMRVSTTMRRSSDNSALPEFIIRDLTDVPPGYATALNFTELFDDYVEYYVDQAELGQSTSSSSATSSSSSMGYSISSMSSWSSESSSSLDSSSSSSSS